MEFTPLYRIQTPRVLLRCWQPGDAGKVLEAIASSLEHLRRWLPWADKEPETLDAKAKRLKGFRKSFDEHREYVYGIFDHDEKEVLGAIGAHGRIGAGAREIGYWIREDLVNRGLITEAASALARVGMEYEKLRRLEIHCDPENLASAAIPRKLGFVNVMTIKNAVRDPAIGPRDTAVWALTAAGYQHSAAAKAEFKGFDFLGRSRMAVPTELRLCGKPEDQGPAAGGSAVSNSR